MNLKLNLILEAILLAKDSDNEVKLPLASTIPNCVSYDPTFHYELAVIFREGLRRMHEKKENIFYYITTMNENYPHPAIP